MSNDNSDGINDVFMAKTSQRHNKVLTIIIILIIVLLIIIIING